VRLSGGAELREKGRQKWTHRFVKTVLLAHELNEALDVRLNPLEVQVVGGSHFGLQEKLTRPRKRPVLRDLSTRKRTHTIIMA